MAASESWKLLNDLTRGLVDYEPVRNDFFTEMILRRKKITQQTFVGLEDVLKTSSRHVLSTSSRHILKRSSTRLQRNKFTSSKTSWRRLESIRRLEEVLKTSWKTKNCYAEDVFNTLWRQTKYELGISVSNKSKWVSNKYIFHKSISDNSTANSKCIN